jgi:hypothetical protein
VDEPRVKRVEVRVEPPLLSSIAQMTAVRWIEEVGEIQKRNDTKWVIQSNLTNQTPVWDMGIHGEGQIIGHIDGKIDFNPVVSWTQQECRQDRATERLSDTAAAQVQCRRSIATGHTRVERQPETRAT